MSQDEAEGSTGSESTTENSEQGKEETPETQEQRQGAWDARRELIKHAPSFASTLVGGDQFGLSGGAVHGDVIFQFGGRSDAIGPASAPILQTDVEALATVFQGCPSFDEALARLRTERVVVLSGGHATGRRSAAMMLLFRLGIDRMRDLEPHTSPIALREQLNSAAGYVLSNMPTSRSHPLRKLHLAAMREQLERTGGHLVISVEPSSAIGDIPSVRWEPPSVEEMLHSHVAGLVGDAAWTDLSKLPLVKEFLDREHPPGEVAQFADQLASLHRGETSEQELATFGEAAVDSQVARWLTGETPHLRDKAFLISLAVFDDAPYAVAAELSDRLFVLLQKIEDPATPPRIPVFGSSRDTRLQLARGHGYMQPEVTDWGLLYQFVARFQDKRVAQALLKEVWNLHPSARPALAAWIHQLAKDGRPLVRTRAAAAAALLATADFPSAMAHLIEPWADANSFSSWLTAANALTLTVLLEVPPAPGILHSWCTGEYKSRRWTAIRAYGLLGAVYHEEILRALLDAVAQQHMDEDEDEQEEMKQLAEALELLLLSAKGPVLKALAERIVDDRAIRNHTLLAFVHACDQTEDDGGRPIVLTWYAQAASTEDTEDERHLTALWHSALNDRTYTSLALDVLRSWIRMADSDPESELALTALLASLATTPTDRQRINHLLRTVRDADGHTPQVAARLLTAIPTH